MKLSTLHYSIHTTGLEIWRSGNHNPRDTPHFVPGNGRDAGKQTRLPTSSLPHFGDQPLQPPRAERPRSPFHEIRLGEYPPALATQSLTLSQIVLAPSKSYHHFYFVAFQVGPTANQIQRVRFTTSTTVSRLRPAVLGLLLFELS